MSGDERIWEIWLSQYDLPCLRAADRLGIFQQLRSEPSDSETLARRLGFDGRVCEVVLRLLHSLGLLRLQDGVFQCSDLADSYLNPEGDSYWGPALNIGPPSAKEEAVVKALREGTEAATGAPDANGVPQPGESGLPVVLWARGEVGAERAEGIARVMHSHSVGAAEHLAGMVSGEARHVLDVGGGSGCFGIALCRRHPEIRCTVLELEGMCEVARRYVEEAGLCERIDTFGCNMFTESWPGRCDTVLLSNVLHDWREESCLLLLKRAFDYLPSGGEVWIHEMLMDRGGHCAAAFSMMMVLGTQGRQYFSEEMVQMLEDAGFRQPVIEQAGSYHSLVRAWKP